MAAPLEVIAYSIPGTARTSLGSVSKERPLAFNVVRSRSSAIHFIFIRNLQISHLLYIVDIV